MDDLKAVPGCCGSTCITLRKRQAKGGNSVPVAPPAKRGKGHGNVTKAELTLMRAMRKASWYLCLRGDSDGQGAYRTILEAFHEWSMMTGIEVPGDIELGLIGDGKNG